MGLSPAHLRQHRQPPQRDSLLPEGTYRTPELTREQLIAAAVKRGFTRKQAEQALALERINQTATFTLTLERGQWTQSFAYDGIREGIGFLATYNVIDHSTVVVTERGATRLSSSTRWREMRSGSVSRTPIHNKCAKQTPNARWASWSGKARSSAGSRCHVARTASDIRLINLHGPALTKITHGGRAQLLPTLVVGRLDSWRQS